jgi:hypothetical protein
MSELIKDLISNASVLGNTDNINKNDNTYFWNDEWNVMDKSAKTYSYDCCKNCPNNPANNPNASGVCFCTLPSMEMVKY